ncbi:MAG: FAD:protein FMN transferase [Brevinematales bacterium]|nr:FAD:protein FMN transferase [Brevinematales bacterium]
MKNKLILPIFFLIFSCLNNIQKDEYSILTMNTILTITTYDKKLTTKDKQAISNTLLELENKFSISRESSIVNQLKKTNILFYYDEEIYHILEKSKLFYEISEKKFDITIGKLASLWGFYNEEYKLPSEEKITKTLSEVGFNYLTFSSNSIKLKKDIWLDFGGILKGYAVEKIATYLKSRGFKCGIVNLGGNLKVFGEKPNKTKWKIGIRDPRKNGEIYKIVELNPEESIATSGDYERFFITNGIRYHHILDPQKGFPVSNGVAGVSVITTNATEADAYSTIMFLFGYEKGIELARKKNIKVIFLLENKENKIYEKNNF